MIISNELTIDMSPVTEAYYGKPKEFLECEKILAKAIPIINKEYSVRNSMGDKGDVYGPKDAAELSRLTSQFEKLLAKGLGVGGCDLIWLGTNSPIEFTADDDDKINVKFKPDAGLKTFTIPSAFTVMTNKFKKNPTRDNIEMKIFVDKAMVYAMSLTPEETMAVILHEAGHNLDCSVFHLISSMIPDIEIFTFDEDKMMKELKGFILGRLLIVPLSRWTAKMYNELIEQLKSYTPGFNAWLSAFSRISAGIKAFSKQIKAITTLTKLDPAKIFIKAINPRVLFGYAGEKYADSAPTAYGYAAANISLQNKLQRYVNGGFISEKELPGYSVITELPAVVASIPFALTDEHPDSGIRMYAQVKKLKRDLNDPNLPKELREELKVQIAEAEKMCAKVVDIRAKPNRYFIFTTLWNKFMIDVLKGYGDPRELMELVWRHEM
jgi:hypothetical protein